MDSVFIQKIKDNGFYNEKFDYSKVDYKDMDTKVLVIDEDGFKHLKSPIMLLKYNNVLKLSSVIDKNAFMINKFHKTHGDRYDYSLVDVNTLREKIKIICPIHGVFEQTPYHHVSRKQGCPICGGRVKKTQTQYILEAKKKYGDKYDYSLVDYINIDTKIKIICPIHGVFEQTPYHHLITNGCTKCNGHYMDTEFFSEKSAIVHDGKYDYSLVDYINGNTKVKIICPIHGVFEQLPSNHLKSRGCLICRSSKKEKIIWQQLTDGKVEFIFQKKFKDLKFKNPLFFDFFIPRLNLIIEYHGEQHYIKAWDGVDGLTNRGKRDELKKKYCTDNNINFMVIKYNEEFDLIINNVIKKYNGTRNINR